MLQEGMAPSITLAGRLAHVCATACSKQGFLMLRESLAPGVMLLPRLTHTRTCSCGAHDLLRA
jgi:hypothetical protein